jgi:hypothetical protein
VAGHAAAHTREGGCAPGQAAAPTRRRCSVTGHSAAPTRTGGCVAGLAVAPTGRGGCVPGHTAAPIRRVCMADMQLLLLGEEAGSGK